MADKVKELKNELSEVKTIEQLQDFITTVKDTQDSDSALAKALDAQLKVLSVIQSPSLTVSAFDLMLESLKGAVEKAENQKQRAEYQRNAAIMTNSMIFFLEAKLYWEKDKWKQEGKDLLQNACELVAESSVAVLSVYATGGASLIGEIGLGQLAGGIGEDLYTNLIKNAGGFFKKLIDLWGKKERIAQYQEEFEDFLLSVFDKLQRHREIYGTQALLGELVFRYKDRLLPLTKNKEKELESLNPFNQALFPLPPFQDQTKGLRVVLYTVSAFFLLAELLFLFNCWGGDKWLEGMADSPAFDTLFSLHFSLLELPFLISVIIGLLILPGLTGGIFLGSSSMYSSASSGYRAKVMEREYKIKEEYYIELAKSFGVGI